jgi:molybdenum cofactor cytidylyltransferase
MMRVAGLVLAAGAATRFGSPKQLAPLDGRPLLQHPLDALAAAGIDDVLVVLGAEAAAIEAGMAWRGERRLVNEQPGDGLASSLRIGLEAAAQDPTVDAVLVVLGDQPGLRPEVIEAVLGAAAATGRPIVRPRYDRDGAPNPVLVRRAAWPLAARLQGDRGLGPMLAANPELVAEVAVPGSIPDVDTPADLAEAAAAVGGVAPAGRGARR